MGAIAAGCQGAGWMRVTCGLGIEWCGEREAVSSILLTAVDLRRRLMWERLGGDVALELMERVGLTNCDFGGTGRNSIKWADQKWRSLAVKKPSREPRSGAVANLTNQEALTTHSSDI
jgi:hypothetical protein